MPIGFLYTGQVAQIMSCLLKEKTMTQYRIDSNSLNRALIGFDQLFNNFEQRFANQLTNNYPPFNIIQLDDDTYEIEIAVAGFKKDEVEVEVNQNQLIVKGEHTAGEDTEKMYHHRGLAARDFTRVWPLAQYVEVRGAQIDNGILTVKLERVIPDAMKPRKIEITEALELNQPKLKAKVA
jgi:molecular chaperone IbpA